MNDPTFDSLFARAAERRAAGPRCRFAPSPTGPLHLGNARSLLLAWLHARLLGADLVMRMEDLDRPRVKAGSAAQILDDLRWLGLDWDEGPDIGGPLGDYTQSRRDALYQTALDRLIARDLVFPCFCSRKDIERAASAPHGHTLTYPGTCRRLDEAGRFAAQARHPDRRPGFRLVVPDRVVTVEDAVLGVQRQDLRREVGDFVVRRSDGLFAYQLAVTVDDALMGITHILRGEDLFPSTPRQIYLWDLLGYSCPEFWHVPLMLDPAGKKMSKRDGSASIAEFRNDGGRPEVLVGQLAASLGLAESGQALSARELLGSHDLSSLNRCLATAAGRVSPA
ncbi:tRNA glutamyl-Q(34) synthetase GluQRS [Acanthopleuribacter pedis]|uniref:Glutamyl-Q tRNA(Asp) synthetase n=1 Tax=Acanthopleuribacter pedis TaxID=442870 RepID=A0A8J7QBB9_9BACT|nr:tRNA glutamyl-Q(34) synthetase GluQRS [Acanthopleuribacter pedis]MBO1321312.1 tRNA glutamyl-Q(34) synthetase GluQRS [Acanthopleuribacter pedis]